MTPISIPRSMLALFAILAVSAPAHAVPIDIAGACGNLYSAITKPVLSTARSSRWSLLGVKGATYSVALTVTSTAGVATTYTGFSCVLSSTGLVAQPYVPPTTTTP